MVCDKVGRIASAIEECRRTHSERATLIHWLEIEYLSDSHVRLQVTFNQRSVETNTVAPCSLFGRKYGLKTETKGAPAESGISK